MKLSSYKGLLVWQKSIDLVSLVYELIKKLPKNEEYAISSQIKRAVISIPSNIAEGYGRHNRKEYIQFLYISIGSTLELETQIIIIEKIYHLDCARTKLLLNEINKMLYSMVNKLKEKGR